MGEKSKWWIALLSPIVAVLLFVAGSLILVPARAQADQVAEHERRLTRQEERTNGQDRAFIDFKSQYDKDIVDIKAWLKKLIDMHMGK